MKKGSRHFVEGVKWAALIERPDFIPAPRSARGAKAAGLRYERSFAKQFPTALHGQWFEYEDRYGRGYCQPDLIVSFLPKCIIVFEVKYTLNDEAFAQLERLYLPVVMMAMNAPVLGCVVAKNLNSIRRVTPIISTLEGVMEKANGITIPVLHWVGQSVVRQTHPLKNKHPFEPFQMRFPTRQGLASPTSQGFGSFARGESVQREGDRVCGNSSPR